MDVISTLMAGLRDMIAVIRSSKNLRFKFRGLSKTLLGRAFEPPSLPSKTRWTSELAFLNSCIKLKPVIDIIDCEVPPPTGDDWKKAAAVCEWLHMAEAISTQLGASQYPTLSLCIRSVTLLKRHYQKYKNNPIAAIRSASSTALKVS